MNQTLKAITKFIAFSILVVQLSACGFHLKGTENVGAFDFSTLSISHSANTNQTLFSTFKRQLDSFSTDTKGSEKAFEIVLGKTEYKAARTSSAQLGDAASELLRMTQSYTVIDLISGETVLVDTVQSLRDRRINRTAILAAERESRSIQQTMRQDLIAQIVRRVQSLSTHAHERLDKK